MEEENNENMLHGTVENHTTVAIVDCKVQLTTNNYTKVNWPVDYPYFTDRTFADVKKLCPFLDSICLVENHNISSKKEWPYIMQVTFVMPVTNNTLAAIVNFAATCERIANRIARIISMWSRISKESKDAVKKFRHANR